MPPPRQSPPNDGGPRSPLTADRRSEETTRTTAHQTEIIAGPVVPLIRMSREFDTAPEQVFQAHTDPDHIVQWLGPRRHRMHQPL